jgi:hypothetical protein
MIDKLAGRIVEFAGAPNRARCFTHVLNLVVKSIMRQFDVPGKEDLTTADERDRELERLAGDIEDEELETQKDLEEARQHPEDEEAGDDNNEGWVDERNEMTEEDVERLEESVRPIRFLLTKVKVDQKLYSIS